MESSLKKAYFSLQMITPIRGRKHFQNNRLLYPLMPGLQMITPIRGRKPIYYRVSISFIKITFTDDNPDKGTETVFSSFILL